MKSDKGSNRIPDAYDADGRPLFYHPPTEEAVAEAELKAKRPTKKSMDTKMRHDRSVNDFPEIDLDDDEYVEVSLSRHPIGIGMIWLGEAVAAAACLALWVFLMSSSSSLTINFDSSAKFYISVVIFGLLGLMLVFGWAGTYVYKNNKFIVTNKRVIQRITSGLFHRSFQTIDIESIEDISYSQSNIFQQMLNYGSIRMSTIGDESTYSLSYVVDPASQISTISKIVSKIKSDWPKDNRS